LSAAFLDIVNREEEGDTRAAAWLLDVSFELRIFEQVL